MSNFSKSSSNWLFKQCKKSNINLQKIFLNNQTNFNNLIWNKGFYLINLAPNPPGTHWCSVCIPKNKNIAYYFDSFGVIPDDSIIASLKAQKIQKIFFSQYAIQSLNSKACGHYCLAFMQYLKKHGENQHTFLKFLNLFTPFTKQNEKILYRLLH